MRQLNPWVLWPVLAATIVGGLIGWIVTSISCQPGTCPATSAAVAATAGIVSGLGVGVVAVLAIRSFAEWRAAQDAGMPPPEPGCEGPATTPDDPAPGPEASGGPRRDQADPGQAGP